MAEKVLLAASNSATRENEINPDKIFQSVLQITAPFSKNGPVERRLPVGRVDVRDRVQNYHQNNGHAEESQKFALPLHVLQIIARFFLQIRIYVQHTY